MSHSAVDTGLWLRRYHDGPASAARVICFPHAGSSASFYFPVSRALAGEAETMVVQYPGRQDRRLEPCARSIAELADGVTAALTGLPDRDLVLYGHSMGAVVAFEVAGRLRDRYGVTPRRLVVSGRRAPSTHRDERVHTLDDEGVLRELKQLSGTDRAILGNDEIVQMVLPTLRGDYTAIETYRHTGDTPLSCPITVLTGDADPRVTEAEAEAWRAHTTGPFELRVFPGGHFFITEHAAEINRMLAGYVA